MPAKVILTIATGPCTGQRMEFAERTTCLIGRARECQLRLPQEESHISRYHCLIDINPPEVQVRDLGSRNGTFLNDLKIGQRHPEQTPKEAATTELFPSYDLKDGDELRLGPTMVRVSLLVPRQCATCGEELLDRGQSFPFAEGGATMLQCENCRAQAKEFTLPATPPVLQVCTQCGQPLSQDIERLVLGGMVCTTCLTTLRQTLSSLLKRGPQREEHPPQNLAGYTVLEELGHGGMGAVYKVQHPRTGEVQALKVLLPSRVADALATAQFLREIKNTRALDHPHVVRFYKTDCAGGMFFFTLEYCEGGTLRQLLKQQPEGRLPLKEACNLILQALSGLHYAHERGLVHRDIKPANLFLSGSGPTQSVKLGDYGLAKAFDQAGLSGLTRTGAAAGTPYYLPRQQVVEFKYAQPEVDVWAMAATLYHLLTGTVPRDFPSGRDPWGVVLETSAKPILQRNPDIPEGLAEVIDRALRDDPQIGFQTARDFQRALEQALKQDGER